MYPVFCQVWNPQSADVPAFLFEINQSVILGILQLFTAIFLVLSQAYQNIIHLFSSVQPSVHCRSVKLIYQKHAE